MTNFVIGEPLMNEAQARSKAKAKAKKLKRETIQMTCTVVGDPTIRAGMPLVFKDVRPDVDGLKFVVKSVTHSFSKNKFVSSIEAEAEV